MSWISDRWGGDELAGKMTSKGRLSTTYPGVVEDCMDWAAADASKRAAPSARSEEHRRRSPWMINSTPNLRAAPPPAGVTTLNWFDAAFRIDRIGCP
jgi:hypothetical protein